MKVLVTGADGQLGREWCRLLDEEEIPFTAADRSSLDITSEDDVQSMISELKPNLVINCAAWTAVDRAEDDPQGALRVNRDGVKYLADACRNSGTKLIHFSTDYVFPGDAEDADRFPEGYPEGAASEPVNQYGKSKRAGEKVLIDSRADYLLIRVAWLCGPGGNNFVNTMLKLSQKNDELRVVEDQLGSPSFTFDVAEAVLELIRRGMSGIWHIRSEGKISWADLAEETFRVAGVSAKVKRIPSDQFPTKAKRPAFSLLSIAKLKEAGMSPPGWKESLRRLINSNSVQNDF